MFAKLLRILIDGQAWLYANQLKLQARIDGHVVSEDQFLAWQDEWKADTQRLALEGEEDNGEPDEA